MPFYLSDASETANASDQRYRRQNRKRFYSVASDDATIALVYNIDWYRNYIYLLNIKFVEYEVKIKNTKRFYGTRFCSLF